MTKKIAGEYFLQGMQEMACSILLKPDNVFQFFFSYGALDRFGSGSWSLSNGRIYLNSGAKPGPDFSTLSIEKQPGDTIRVKIEHPNPAFSKHVYCSLQNGAEGSWQPIDESGEIEFEKQEFKAVSLLFEFCAERFTIVPVDTANNFFVFRPEPWLAEIFFENFSLQVEENGLSGKHPLMEGDNFRYEKG